MSDGKRVTQSRPFTLRCECGWHSRRRVEYRALTSGWSDFTCPACGARLGYAFDGRRAKQANKLALFKKEQR